MFSFRNHPFAVEAFFESSLVLTYAVKKEELQPLIPACVELDTFKDKWAFVAVAIVKTKALRPKGFPAFLGNDFILVGFRIFVRYVNNQGKRLRGLYIIKSETDKVKMSVFGNFFTHYKYQTTDIKLEKTDDSLHVYSKKSAIHIEVATNQEAVELPQGSPFANWKEARRFAGPLPFTFTYQAKTNDVLVIEGVRQNWEPAPVKVTKNNIGFIDSKEFKTALLANAFLVENIPYHWKKGKVEKWKK